MDSFSIRRATPKDVDFYFTLRNDPAVRAASFGTESISRATHDAWFKKKLSDPHTHLFLLQDGDMSVGQVRIDISDDGRRGTVNVAVLPTYYGKRYASRGIALSCAAVFREFSTMKEIVALIKKENLASRKTFEKNHFIHQGELLRDGAPTIKMSLPRPT